MKRSRKTGRKDTLRGLGRHLMVSWLLAAAPIAGASMIDGMGPGMMGAGAQHGMPGNSPTTTPAASIKGNSKRGEKEFRRVCSGCHALPDPSVHTAGQWPRVVSRMQGYMSSYGMPSDPHALKDIEDYLKEHAASP